MTNAAKSVVWIAEYQPWGSVQSLSGPLTLDLRFPGQWFQLEAGLHYNWHRHYDPSLGRYTQPDPLGFVDGPSVYGYGRTLPLSIVDPSGLQGPPTGPPPSTIPGGPWTWSPDPGNGRDGTYQGAQRPDGTRPSATWDGPDGHWDVDDGYGNRQRYNRHGAPISKEEAHGDYKGPPRTPFPPRFCPPVIILPPRWECMVEPRLPGCGLT